jgi:hypothetical protein
MFNAKNLLVYFIFTFAVFCATSRQTFTQTVRRPLVVIPGITGSQLINAETGEIIWFRFTGVGGDDDLRLPITPNIAGNKDNLVAKDIIREVKLPSILPDIGVYDNFLNTLKKHGYAEGDWENPQSTDVFYVFAYDWRRDNVESAHFLIQKLETIKSKLNRPDLKFDLLAHSMGGLVARYAAMYGTVDLPGREPRNRKLIPDWSGARHINQVLLFGTPNAGSMSGFTSLIKGYTIGNRNLPFINDLTIDEVFTIPALYELMPYEASARFLDENLKPISVDLYNPQTWRKYGWGAINNPSFLGKLKDAANIKGITPAKGFKPETIDDKILAETTYAQAQAYFAAVLARAKQFHEALNVKVTNAPIKFSLYGSDCLQTLDAIVLVRDKKRNVWRTITEPADFRTVSGRKVSEKEVRRAIYSLGDNRVTQTSLLGNFFADAREITIKTALPIVSKRFFCEPHYTLLNNATIQASFLSQLDSNVVTQITIK